MNQVDSKKEPRKEARSKIKDITPGFPLLNSAGSVWFKFHRFVRDIIGVTLIAISLLILFGLVGLTAGILISPVIKYIQTGLGWGSIFISILMAFIGLAFLQRQPEAQKINLSRILAIEGLIFSILALLAVFGGQSLDGAEAGKYGGIIGWGIVNLLEYFLPQALIPVILLLLVLIFMLWGFGLFQLIGKYLDKWVIASRELNKSANNNELDIKSHTSEIKKPLKTTFENKKTSKDKQVLRVIEEVSGGELKPRDDKLPPLSLLFHDQSIKPDEQLIHDKARLIEKTLTEFGLPAKVVGYRIGPTVTQYAIEPGFIEKSSSDSDSVRQKVRVSQISALARDLALALAAERLRIEAPVPGRSFVGIEVPNENSEIVRLRSLIETEAFQKLASPLAIALGRNVSGQPVVADLARMPHLLIAGTTGSGKSVCIAALTICLVMNNSPADLRLALLDPKMVELIRFNGLPHLLGKVETGTERMLGILRWALSEMDRRYRLLEDSKSRDLDSYNRKMQRKKIETLPRIIILIDELADLMMAAPDQTEHSLIRLAQMARATGIHLVVATQRPSTDVVTGLIKANFPARVSFTVASSIDSRVILDSSGAENLLGKGDMLFLNPELGNPIRAQGVMVTDQEVEKVISYWQKTYVVEDSIAPWEELLVEDSDKSDELIQQAISVVSREQKASVSLLQRRLRVGYPRAARLIDDLEKLGIVGPAQVGGRDREVLLSPGDKDSQVSDDDPET